MASGYCQVTLVEQNEARERCEEEHFGNLLSDWKAQRRQKGLHRRQSNDRKRPERIVSEYVRLKSDCSRGQLGDGLSRSEDTVNECDERVTNRRRVAVPLVIDTYLTVACRRLCFEILKYTLRTPDHNSVENTLQLKHFDF